MANIERRMGEVIGFNNFDPESIDVAEIQALSEAIPKDGHVDLAIAPVLACKFLKGADLCGELFAILSWWCAKKEDMKKRAHAEAFLIRAKAAGYNTVAERKSFADNDEGYFTACDEANRAETLKTWAQIKHQNFIKAHHLMKEVLRGEQQQLPTSKYDRSLPAPKIWGEVGWGDES